MRFRDDCGITAGINCCRNLSKLSVKKLNSKDVTKAFIHYNSINTNYTTVQFLPHAHAANAYKRADKLKGKGNVFYMAT